MQELAMIFALPRCAWNVAWRPCFAKIFVPKNFPNKPCRTKVPTKQRESRNLPWSLLPRVALETLLDAHALQKFSRRKISRTNLAEPKFQRNSANPRTSHDSGPPASLLRRCVAPVRCETFLLEKFPGNLPYIPRTQLVSTQCLHVAMANKFLAYVNASLRWSSNDWQQQGRWSTLGKSQHV